MKLIFLYKSISEFGRITEEFAQRIRDFHPQIQINLIESESFEGIEKASLYDIMTFPAILAVTEDSILENAWIGPSFPSIDEVMFYVR